MHMDPSGLRSLIVITNDWHMPRTEAIFRTVFSLPSTHCLGGGSATGAGTAEPWAARKELAILPRRCRRGGIAGQWAEENIGQKAAFLSDREEEDVFGSYSLSFRAAPSGVPDPHLLEVRVAKEQRALAQFLRGEVPALRSFQALHRWIYTRHAAYSTLRLIAGTAANSSGSSLDAIPPDLLKTY
jgi:hypothetical protein